jgi:NDP-sugar pyrophosphorylase family protein
MKPTLIILAAGLGSRYQGTKQTDSFGPNGEQLLDYTVFDAIRCGFGKVVFVIKPEMMHTFMPEMKIKLKNRIETTFVSQTITDLPNEIHPVEHRVKPWGTGHALWVCRKEVSTPFAMVNADDFYGKQALQKMNDALLLMHSTTFSACLIAYKLKHTLSKFGSVSRGICEIENGLLRSITEQTEIKQSNGEVYYKQGDKKVYLDGDVRVSMNLMGFTPDVFSLIEQEFRTFYGQNLHSEKAEFYAPQVLQKMIDEGASVPVLDTDSSWFGVTYPEDKPEVQRRLKALVDKESYPRALWN